MHVWSSLVRCWIANPENPGSNPGTCLRVNKMSYWDTTSSTDYYGTCVSSSSSSSSSSISGTIKKSEEKKMVEMKELKSINLKEGKKQAQDEKATYEIEAAKTEYTRLFNKKERIERDIKALKEELKEATDKLKVFN